MQHSLASAWWRAAVTVTRAHRQEFLSAKHADLLKEEDVELVQNKSPKVDAKTLAPASFPSDPDLEWCAACAGARTFSSGLTTPAPVPTGCLHAFMSSNGVLACSHVPGLPARARSSASPTSVWHCSRGACGAAWIHAPVGYARGLTVCLALGRAVTGVTAQC